MVAKYPFLCKRKLEKLAFLAFETTISPDWPKLAILQPQPSKFWNDRFVPPCLFRFQIFSGETSH
jgi:hypothetical protein